MCLENVFFWSVPYLILWTVYFTEQSSSSMSFLGDENVLKLGSDDSWHTVCHFHDAWSSVLSTLSFFSVLEVAAMSWAACGELRPAYTTWVLLGKESLVPGLLRSLQLCCNWTRTTHLPWILDPQKWWEIINIHYFQLLSFVVIC